jgi:hypothetical protein
MSDSIPIFTIDKETKELFIKTRDLLDQILETFEILEDKELMNDIKQAEKDYQEEKYVSLDEYKKGKRSFG